MRIEGEVDAAGVLAGVVDAALGENFGEAARLASTLERPYWLDVKAQHKELIAQLVHERKIPAPETNGRGRNDPDKRRRREIYQRDHYVCRYAHCGRHTVDEWVLAALGRLLPEELTYHPNWKLTVGHPVIWTYAATLEHVLPWSQGGGNDDTNLITACAGCNYSKSNHTIESLGWQVGAVAPTETWDGLVEFVDPLNDLADRLGRPPTPTWGGWSDSTPARPPVIVSFDEVTAGSFVSLVLPGNTAPYCYRVVEVSPDGATVQPMWVDRKTMTWAVGKTVTQLSRAEWDDVDLLADDAPGHGDPAR